MRNFSLVQSELSVLNFKYFHSINFLSFIKNNYIFISINYFSSQYQYQAILKYPCVLLPCYRRLRSFGRRTHRVPPGEVAVRPGGVLPDAIPEPADEVRQTAAAATVVENGLVAGDRAALLRAAGW